MNKPRKVVWTKGMFLMPQHFQEQDEYIEYALHFRGAVSNFANWGFSRLGIDEASLVNGHLTLRHCEGIFSDGLFFQAPLIDELPEGRPVEEHMADPQKPFVDAYLGIPAARTSSASYQFNSSDGDGHSAFRYTVEARPTMDATMGTDEKVIQVARKSLRLLFDDENLDGFTTCRVARIQRSAAGTFILAPEFVPPLLDLAASDYLLTLTRRLIEIMAAKVKSHALKTRTKSGHLADFTPSEAADFWYLHTLNTGLPELNHVWKVARGHPETLYRTMLRLAGALTTFSLDDSVRDLADYDHNALGECFTSLDERIRELLNFGPKDKYLVTPLRPVDRFVWQGVFNDERQLDASQLILSIGSSIPVDELIGKMPKLAKISSPDDLGRLIRNALPGLPLHHLASPPPVVRFNPASQYFAIPMSGPLWENIRRSRSLAVFVPGEIGDPKLELLTIVS